ncbi:Uncharacterised protein [Actinobacillus equuli]|nr:Uncharacterised protein [Actinobacillus equuli]
MIELSGDFKEIDERDIRTTSIGKIYSDNGLEFTSVNKEGSSIANHGILNVKGSLTYDAQSFLNNAQSLKTNVYEYIFKHNANITVKHTIKHPTKRGKFLFSAPDQRQEATLTFRSLAELMEKIFTNNDAFKTPQGFIRRADLLRTIGQINSPSLKKVCK